MASPKYILESIKIEGILQEIIAKSTDAYVTVTYDGAEMTLAAALTKILQSAKASMTETQVNEKISAAVDELIGGAPGIYDTFKEIADYIEAHKSVETALNEAIGNKVTAEAGKGLSTNDFTTILKEKLEALPAITADNVASWNAKADKTEATQEKAGLMSAADKKRVDKAGAVFFGETEPAEMRNGDLFVKVVSVTA